MYRRTSLLYDPDCGICVATAAWLRSRVPAAKLRLLPLTAAPGDPILGETVIGRPLSKTLHVVAPDGRVLTGARAVLATGRLVPGWRVLAAVLDNRLSAAILEPIYREIARKRRRIGRLLGLPATCAADDQLTA
jgi:predicted DCC family thiol-disulfide oxidoreductase YuxK